MRFRVPVSSAIPMKSAGSAAGAETGNFGRHSLTCSANIPAFIFPSAQDTLHCMTFSEEDLREFQTIWKGIFHEEIPMEEARIVAADVIELYSLLGQTGSSQSRSEGDQKQPK
jgi:hypothetical protein